MVKISECNLCGKKVNFLNKIEIEGSVLEVCNKCTKFGRRVVEIENYKPIVNPLQLNFQEKEWELIENYGKYIKKARENKGLNLEEFAKRLNEKVSVIRRIEANLMEPDEELLKKIENFLEINLRTTYEERFEGKSEKKKPKLTLGDVAKIK
ncbi:MAG: multiprotein bridging factor aMBF1 [Candidatus Aenigmatarchaeota archaeon]